MSEWVASQRWSRGVAFLIAIIPFVLLSLAHWHLAPLLVRGDYAQYVLHARAILEGRPYGDTGYLYSQLAPFVGPPLQPPGLPLTLVPVVWAFGINDTAFRLVMVLSGIAFLLLATIGLARTEGWLRAGCAAALTGIALERAYATNVPLSDIGFCALVWAVVVVADRPGRWTLWRGVVVSVLIAAALGYRTAGAPLLPAIFVYGLWRRRTVGPVPLAVACGWIVIGVVVLLATPLGAAVMRFAADARGVSIQGLRFAIQTYAIASLHPLLYPFPDGIANLVYHVATAPLAAFGCWQWARENRHSFLFTVTVAFALFLLLAPAFQERYLWPLFPIIAAGLIRALVVIATRVRSADPRVIEQRTCMGLLAIAVCTVVTIVRAPRPATLDDAPEFLDVFAWLKRANADSAIRVAIVNPRVLTLRTGIPAMAVSIHGSIDARFQELVKQRITFVVEGDPGYAATEMKLLQATRSAFPQAFVPVYRNAKYTVYRVEPSAAGTIPAHIPGSGAT